MADPVNTPPVRRREVDNDDLDFLDHVKNFFMDRGKSKEIVDKGGPGGQRREKTIMDAVDGGIAGAKDDSI